MNVLEKRPELKEILGRTGKEGEFEAFLNTISSEDLAALNHYLGKALDKSEVEVWKNTQQVRKVENQINFLKQDYKVLRGKLQLIQNDLKSSFNVIYKKPVKAEVKCSEWENKQGLIKTGWTIRNRPSIFGNLRGFTLFGVITSTGRKNAKEKALDLNYEGMKKSFNEGKKIAMWLGHILKGA